MPEQNLGPDCSDVGNGVLGGKPINVKSILKAACELFPLGNISKE